MSMEEGLSNRSVQSSLYRNMAQGAKTEIWSYRHMATDRAFLWSGTAHTIVFALIICCTDMEIA